jgi:hypothetical protein
MKTQPSFVGADRAVHLNTKPAIDMKIALIVPPRNAKHDHSFRLNDALQNFLVPIFGVLFENNRKRVDYFLHCLMKLRFGRVLRLHLDHQLCNVISHGNVFGISHKLCRTRNGTEAQFCCALSIFLLGRINREVSDAGRSG